MLIEYLWSVLRHKWFVFIEACKMGVPLLGLTHDGSKFCPWEFFPYARYFYGGEYLTRNQWHGDLRNDYPESLLKENVDAAFDRAWNLHQKCNKHHWQFWTLIQDSSDPQIKALPMPERYIREMVADWRGAGRAYGNPDTAAWYAKNRGKQIMHPNTQKRVEELLEAMR